MSATVLVIDDQPAMRRLIATILTQENYDVVISFSVNEALQTIEAKPPDVVCCDLMMPERSGLDFLAHCQQAKELNNVPVIIITGTGEEDMAEKAIALGAYGFLAKPFSRAQLTDLVKAALHQTGEG